MREWIKHFIEANPLITSIIIFVLMVILILIIRRFIMNRLYKKIQSLRKLVCYTKNRQMGK